MQDEEFADVARKFYPDEATRQRKQRNLRNEIAPVAVAIKDIVEDLYLKDIRFAVFDMKPNTNPPRIHVGITMCCEKKKLGKDLITLQLRQEIADQIIGQTKFKDVKWEL